MPSATALRIQIEQALESRFPASLSPAPKTIREVASTGITDVDRMLDGGLPVGAISEITGPESSGRTSLALAFVAQRSAEDRFCAWVDANDAFDPESAAATGINLRQLLWIRCKDDAPAAGTPICAPSRRQKRRPWTRLDQALRATDLLLQTAGFASIVLDLGDTAPEHGTRIPLATWFRFRQAADRTRCSLVILGKAPYAQSSASLALECASLSAETAGAAVLRRFTFNLQRGRQRFTPITNTARKPPASAWSAAGAWDAEKRA